MPESFFAFRPPHTPHPPHPSPPWHCSCTRDPSSPASHCACLLWPSRVAAGQQPPWSPRCFSRESPPPRCARGVDRVGGVNMCEKGGGRYGSRVESKMLLKGITTAALRKRCGKCKWCGDWYGGWDGGRRWGQDSRARPLSPLGRIPSAPTCSAPPHPFLLPPSPPT